MSNNLRARTCALIVLVPLASACSWFTDFKQQPSVGTWQHFSSDSAAGRGFRGNPAGSVPTTGSTVPGFMISYSNFPVTVDSFSVVRNPVAVDGRSLENGRKYYAINCAVCHGDVGDGNGALKQASALYGFAPPIISDIAKNYSDGYIWGIMRNGRGIMPSYNRIEDMDRWDVVNYIRGLQGKLAQPVPTGPLGMPGETGSKLPGATRIGPTVPSAFARPTQGQMTGVDRRPEGRP
ncbi:MAG: cytochrome c [Gemmatimonadetes bacterium]|nr:cytochrome c [Gemmatimonadota bacterium]